MQQTMSFPQLLFSVTNDAIQSIGKVLQLLQNTDQPDSRMSGGTGVVEPQHGMVRHF